ncbi:MAG: hypothetical protein COU27_00305 [Candidatus Levybacteria bacterium CG10_big_fil_rev_8_21_14_0_10_36_7]|nr:MAG: hypothetical protein COU27_00305 [Candidatus Levybacteria bacterium CG10_big_fil_rev_8_21_14_0_10_36_7]
MGDNKNKKIDDNLDAILNDLKTDDNSTEHKVEELQKALEETQKKLDQALKILEQKGGSVDSVNLVTSKNNHSDDSGAQRVVEGVFNGESMVGGDGKKYNVPANYASKSKLVEGDILKLTINKEGSFIYKQIGPIDRKQLIAKLGYDEGTGDWYASSEGKQWRLLTASVTYFKGEPGDEVVIILPKGSQTNWAAVENIIKM